MAESVVGTNTTGRPCGGAELDTAFQGERAPEHELSPLVFQGAARCADRRYCEKWPKNVQLNQINHNNDLHTQVIR